jgi:uncharacterized glyoxalase superfamily protein PhnB
MYTPEDVRENAPALVKACQNGSALVARYLQDEVRPLILRRRPSSGREEAFWRYFQRLEASVTGISVLKDVSLVQLVYAGTRTILEILVDSTLLYHGSPPDAVERIEAWEMSAKLKVAEAAVAYARKVGREDRPRFVQMAELIEVEGENIRRARARYWPSPKTPGLGRHPDRWTDRNLLEDCRHADRLHGLKLEEFYETTYRQMNWSIHGSGFASTRGIDAPSLALDYAQGHLKSAEFALNATDIILSGLRLKNEERGRRLEEVRLTWADLILEGAPGAEARKPEVPAPAFNSVRPVLAVRDLREALTYYREALGFHVAWTWGTPPTRAGVTRDGIELQLVSDGVFGPPGPSYVYFHLTGVDQYYQECRKRGAEVASDLADRPFGMRDFRVVDPSGNRLGFGEPLARPTRR